MVTFIDEWRRKFPSCMVVKMLMRPIFATGSDHVAAVLIINQTYNNLGLYDSVADSQILLLNNQSIVQLEVHLLGIKVSHNIFISST